MIIFRPFLLLAATLAMTEEPALLLQPATAGGHTVEVKFRDRIPPPNLERITVDGYTLENVLFLQENDSTLPSRALENLLFVPDSQNYAVVSWDKRSGIALVEAPPFHLFGIGTVVVDTVFGGIAGRILSAIHTQQLPGHSLWQLQLAPVSLRELMSQADVSFQSRLSLAHEVADSSALGQLEGWNADSSAQTASEYRLRLERFEAAFTGQVSGGLRLTATSPLTMVFHLRGRQTIQGKASIALTAPGRHSLRRSFGEGHTWIVPVVRGLYLTLTAHAEAFFEVSSRDSSFSASVDLPLTVEVEATVECIRDECVITYATLEPVLDEEKNDASLAADSSTGWFRFGISPVLGVRWNGEEGYEFRLVSGSEGRQEPHPAVGRNRLLSLHSEVSGRRLPAEAPGTILDAVTRIVRTPPRGSPLPQLLERDTSSLLVDWVALPDAAQYLVQLLDSGGLRSSDTVVVPPFRIDGLSPASGYEVRVWGLNRQGAGEAGVLPCSTGRHNKPPSLPLAIVPLSGQALAEEEIRLVWSATDPEETPLRYALFLDTASPPAALVLRNSADTSFLPLGLLPGTKYFWKVAATDGVLRTEGPVWNFTTAAPPPPATAAAPRARKVSEPGLDTAGQPAGRRWPAHARGRILPPAS